MSEVVATAQQGLAGKYPPYPEYKDSGVEWLQLCPSSWETKALKYIVSCNDEVLSESTDPDMEFEYIDIGGVSSSEGITRTESMRFSGAPSRARRIVRQGDIIVSTVRTYLEAIAPISLEFDGKIASTGFAVLRPKYLLSGFAKYALRARHFIDSVVARSTGVSYPAINSSELIDIKIVVPSLKEQQTIASFLDYETARIDRLIAQQQRLIELLKEKRQAVISHAVTKGLNPNAPMKDSGVEWLGQVPEHWQIQKTAWHFTAQKGRNGQMLTKEYCGENSGDYPVYSGQTENNGIMGRIDSFEFDFGNDGCLFSTTVGAKAMSLSLLKGKFSLSQNCMVIIPRENNAFSVSFAFYHFQPLFSYERGLIPEHMQASFRMDDLYQYSIAMPPVSEQIEISDFINGEVIKIDYLVQIAEKAITLMQERRSALISAAVTGKIDLRGWTQPAEEVAA
ncbi:restriction endonuclease subunit S [Aeromonas veronii]